MRRLMLAFYFLVIALSGLPFAYSVWTGAVAAQNPSPNSTTVTSCESRSAQLYDDLWVVYMNEVRHADPERHPLAHQTAYLALEQAIAGAIQQCPAQSEALQAVLRLRYALAGNVELLHHMVGADLKHFSPKAPGALH